MVGARAISVEWDTSFALRAILLVLLSTSQDLQMTSFLGEELFGRANEAGGALLLYFLLLNELRLLGLNDLRARPGTSLRGPAKVSVMLCDAKGSTDRLSRRRSGLRLLDCALCHFFVCRFERELWVSSFRDVQFAPATRLWKMFGAAQT